MSKEIKNLEPKSLWENFHQLTLIPRPSKHEEKAIVFVENFGKALGLDTIRDQTGNVIIRKPATSGMENRKTVVLQGHLDMVPQKNSHIEFDFTKDPISTFIDGEWVTAKETTLGADNGIGVAAAMAVLQSKELVHGPIEALFTMDEETGMTGAVGLKPDVLKGDILINMDSEDEGELYVGCAGGVNASMEFEYNEDPVPQDDIAYQLNITGLKGGHSGMDIILGRANANKLMFRFLKHAVVEHEARMASINGGSLRNAIPREAFAIVTIPVEEETDFLNAVADFETTYQEEYGAIEPSLSFTAEPCELPSALIHEMAQDDLINAVVAAPNGVYRMSTEMEGAVETSSNLAIVKSENGKIHCLSLVRSSVESVKADLCSAIESVFALAGAKVTFDGDYPGWKPNPNSEILKVMQNTYQGKWGKTPEIKAIHAGLECGILGAGYPNLDMISFGPTIRFPHSPDEKVNIESVNRFWEFLVATLEQIPEKA